MKYFVDFEATQFSNEIISIGCIREDGETFYSLIAPVEGKITPFITNLTGITKEMVDEAMNPDTVFETFHDWVFADERSEAPDFFCWGSSDVDFLRATFKRTKSLKARMMIGYMAGSLRDYAVKWTKRTKIVCALVKAYNCIDPEYVQTHNALDDAVMLAKVYNATERLDGAHTIFSSLKELKQAKGVSTPVIKWTDSGLPAGTVCIIDQKKQVVNHFADYREAAKWVLDNKIDEKCREQANLDKIANKVKTSCNNQSKLYFGLRWARIPVPKTEE